MLKIVKRIIDLSGERKDRMYLSFFYAIINTFFTGMPVVGVAYSVKLVIQDMQGQIKIGMNHVYLSIAFMVFATVGKIIFSYLLDSTQESVGYEMLADERLRVGDTLKRVSMGFFGEKDSGQITSAVTTDMSFVENYSMKLISSVLNGYINAITMSLFLSIFDIRIGIIAIFTILLSSIMTIYIDKKSDIYAPLRQETQASLVSVVVEYVRGMSIVKAFKQDDVAKDAIEQAFGKSKQTNYSIEKEFSKPVGLYLFLFKIGSVSIVIVSSLLAIKGTMDVSTMIMMVIFTFIIFNQVEQIGRSINMIRMVDASLDRIEEVKNAEFIDQDSVDIKLKSYDIEFNNVVFAYKETSIIKDISFKIPENTTTAIVGPSGGGKSTICNLIARFYDIQEGKILVGGVDVKNITCNSLLQNISMVFQNVYLFHDTIKNNIKFGNPDATDQQIIEAAKKARCHEFINLLPKGYDTMVGECGSNLSGGEKQRISIARAILKNAPIVILDEATASIDPENEHHIQAAISELTHGKTIITIAHRLATIENADQILVVNDGEIAQRGKHKELLKEEGIYKRFISIREKAEEWSI